MTLTELFRGTTPTEPEPLDNTGVLYRRTRTLRWTNRFPTRSGLYWVRHNEARWNPTILHVSTDERPERFADVEFSDRTIPRPLEPDDVDETDYQAVLADGNYALVNHAYDVGNERGPAYWVITAFCLGVCLGIIVMWGMSWLSIHHG